MATRTATDTICGSPGKGPGTEESQQIHEQGKSDVRLAFYK